MKSLIVIEAGVCGFVTRVHADSEDSQNVTFRIPTSCEKVKKLAEALVAKGPVDAYAEIGAGHDGVVLGTAREHLKGCCAGCVVPSGIFKAMQVAAGLALPKDIAIRISKPDEGGTREA